MGTRIRSEIHLNPYPTSIFYKALEDAVLQCTRLRKRFGGLFAVDGVDLSLLKGAISLIIGPNGSGKSSLINLISGFYIPDEGRIMLNGWDITTLPSHERFRIGIFRSFQNAQLFPSLTVLQNLIMAAGPLRGEKILSAILGRDWPAEEERLAKKAFRVIELLGLAHLSDQPASNLSGGQMKLVELGRAIMSGAQIVLLDEPTAGLNPVIAEKILQYIKTVASDFGITFLIVEHRLDLAMKYVDNVYAMFGGRIIAEGKPEYILSLPEVIESYLGERQA